jgi:hypothetical protein
MSKITVGPGDEATWGSCVGHPNDPRTDTSEVYEVEGQVYDLDAGLTADDLADLLEHGRKTCEKAGMDWQTVLDLAVLYLRGAER